MISEGLEFESCRPLIQRIMALLGDDGLGYELAKKLESNGAWRAWLGDSHYMQLMPHFASLSAWQSFMAVDGTKSRAQIQLQLRVRALLFEKASTSLFLRPGSSAALATLNPSHLQLHADDVYFSLEEDAEDWSRLQAEGSLTLKSLQMKGSNLKRSFSSCRLTEQVVESTSCVGSKFKEAEFENVASKSKNGEMPEIWYNQWLERHLPDRMQRLLWRLAQQKLPFSERETYKRTPEGMSAYLSLSEKHRKKRGVIKQDLELLSANSSRENGSGVSSDSNIETDWPMEEEIYFFPETMFPSNCVPDNPLPVHDREADNTKIEFYGILDNLPNGLSRSPMLIERFGMRSEYLSLGLKKSENSGKNRSGGTRKTFSEEEACHVAQQSVVRIIEAAGFEGLKESTMEVLSQLLSCHICKLGHILRLLADSYRKQYSQIELLRMFLHTIGYSNLGTLMEYLKAGTKISSQQAVQQLTRTTQPQQQTVQPQAQQIQRQLSQQMHLLQQQTLALQQQQWEKARRKQPSTPRNYGRKLEKERIMGDMKMESTSELAMECKAASPLVSPQQAQWQQQQQLVQGSHHPQVLQQFKQLSSFQHPQIQQQGLFPRDNVQIRTQPVKVEGFQELMGGDVSMKQETEDEIQRTMTSPIK